MLVFVVVLVSIIFLEDHQPLRRLSKFGASFALNTYLPDHLSKVLEFVHLSLCTTTWATYKVAWMLLFSFLTCFKNFSLPLNTEALLSFAKFLFCDKKLQYETVVSYISASKFLHTLKCLPVVAYSNPILKLTLIGMKNQSLVQKVKTSKKPRLILSYPVLRILGHEVFNDHSLSPKEKQTIWTFCCVCWWSSCRGGELLPPTMGKLDSFRAIRWSSFRKVSNDHYKLHLRLTKTNKNTIGDTVDLFSYSDTRYDPVYNLKKLARLCNFSGKDSEKEVFVFDSSKPISMRYINKKLKLWLKPYDFSKRGSFACHSFRAGLVSHLSSMPHLFTKSELKQYGRWNSDCWRKYARLHGVSAQTTVKKLQPFLSSLQVCFGCLKSF